MWLFLCIFAKANNRDMKALKGKVHQVTESILLPRRRASGATRERLQPRMTLTFDADGHIVEELYRDRKYASHIVYKYNKKGHCTERREYNAERRLARRYLYRYDQWGNQIEEQGYNAQGSLTLATSHRYNAQGDELEHRMRRNESSEKVTYKLDANGHVEEEIRTRNGKFVSRSSYRYDEHGQKIETLTTDHEGNSNCQRHRYRYNDEGRIVEECLLDENGAVATRYTFAYDGAGNVTERCHADRQGRFSGTINRYDEHNKLLTTQWYSSDDLRCGRTDYEYDDGRLVQESMTNGRLQPDEQTLLSEPNGVVQQVRYRYSYEHTVYCHRHRYYADGHLQETTEVHYDEQGNPVQQTLRRYDTLGNLLCHKQNDIETRYQYDAQGNWVRRTQLLQDEEMETVVRDITYYE